MVIIQNILTAKKDNENVYAYVGRKSSIRYAYKIGGFYDFSILGNPFHMNTESEREKVCLLYEELFKGQLSIEDSPFSRHFKLLLDLYDKTFHEKKNLVLLCFCYPKKCHAETLEKEIIKYFEGEF